MAKLKKRINLTKQTMSRYPDALADLFTLGEPDKDLDYGEMSVRLRDHVASLIAVVTDEDLSELPADETPAAWAQVHALRVLRILAPAEAAEPMTTTFGWSDDWMEEEYPSVFAAIGAQAIPPLRDYLFDSSHNALSRATASHCLRAIAESNPVTQGEIVQLLTSFLDRPQADASADEEEITTFVISDLGDLGDRAAWPAIQRAYSEDRVTTYIVAQEDIERSFGIRPELKPGDLPQTERKPGVSLSLRCTACGREREHTFPRVYFDMGTGRDPKKRLRYDPLIIPQFVVCPKCGAEGQYELGDMGRLTLTAEIVAATSGDLKNALPPDQRITLLEFTTRWGPMHPQEAIERYEKEIARHPDNVALHVGFGNVLRFLGRYDEAIRSYIRATELDDQEIDGWLGRAQATAELGDLDQAIRCWEMVRTLALVQTPATEMTRTLVTDATECIAELRNGKVPVFEPVMLNEDGSPAIQGGSGPPANQAARKVGRNDPCPCGSGRKYKHCHGKPGM